MRKFFSRLIWLFLFGLLSLIAGFTSVQAWHARQSKGWPTVTGTVVSFPGGPTYQYSVGGKRYEASYVSCNEFFGSGGSVKNSSRYAVRYPLDGKITVHYCPSDPARAALETEFDSSVLKFIAVVGLFACLCAAGFVFGWPIRFGSRSRWPFASESE